MNLEKDFINHLKKFEPSKSLADKFRDFCELAYCAYAKPMVEPERQDELEARYNTYRDKDAIRSYPKLIAMIFKGVESGDFLGSIAAEIGALNSEQGQFFTPYHVSRLMAEIAIGDHEPRIAEKGYITMQEPAAGAGGMILATAHVLQNRGYNPSNTLFVSAIDINSLCYWMTYLQLTLAGIPAQVFRGNSLSQEMFESAWTSAAVPFLGKHGDVFASLAPETIIKAVTMAPALRQFEPIRESQQLALF
jgi:hypothetical protein